VPGITPVLAQALQAAGFTSRQALLAGDLKTVKGIGAAKEAAIKAALQATPDVAAVLAEIKQALGEA